MNNLSTLASLTYHFTAPHEPTLAVFPNLHLSLRISPIAAQQVTTSDGRRVRVTLATLSSQGALLFAPLAEIWRLVGVDQILLRWRLDGEPARDDVLPVVGDNHLDGPVKPFLQTGANFPERWHFLPAGLQGAGTGKSMAFAFFSHEVLDSLRENERK